MFSLLSSAATRTFLSAIEVGEVSSSNCGERGEVLVSSPSSYVNVDAFDASSAEECERWGAVYARQPFAAACVAQGF